MKHTCRFCQKETVYVPLVIKANGHSKRIKVFYCYDCQAEYAYFGDLLSVHLYTTIKDRMYRWSVEWDGTMGRLWYVGKPGTPGQVPNKELKLVKDFKQTYPTITPQNVNDKIRFILLFL